MTTSDDLQRPDTLADACFPTMQYLHSCRIWPYTAA